MSEKPGPLSDSIRRALDVERARPAPSPEQIARLASRLETTFAAGAAVAGAAAAGSATGAGAATGKALFGGKLVLLAAAAGVAAGGIGGASLHARFAEPRVIEVTKIVEVKVPVPVAREPEARPEVPPEVAPRGPRPAVEARSNLDTERLLVEQATAALSRGQAAQALEACDRHAARFPKGQLVEERESVAIRALVLAGRADEARQRAEAFRARFPGSMLQGVIDAAMRE